MKVIFKNLMIAATLLAGFTSCSNDDDSTGNGGAIPTGETTTFTLTVAQPKTYATDPNATIDESKVNTIDVFIFGADNALEKRVSLVTEDFTNNNGEYTNNDPIVTLTGPKKIYAGVNLTDELAREVTDRGLSAIYNVMNAGELMGSNGFVMFSRVAADADFVTTTSPTFATANKVSVSVARLLAKVSVLEGSGLSSNVLGGKVSDLKFKVNNIAKQYYMLPKVSGISPDNALANFYNENETSFKALNAKDADIITSNVSYALENSSGEGRQGYSTYASIRVKFLPTSVVKLETTGDASSKLLADVAPSTPQTFYTVLNAGVRYYFLEEADAAAYDAKINPVTPSVKEYTDGYSYYKVYLNPDNGFKVFRNNLYKVNVMKINGIGENDGSAIDKPDDKIPSPTNITVTVTVEDWIENVQNTEI